MANGFDTLAQALANLGRVQGRLGRRRQQREEFQEIVSPVAGITPSSVEADINDPRTPGVATILGGNRPEISRRFIDPVSLIQSRSQRLGQAQQQVLGAESLTPEQSFNLFDTLGQRQEKLTALENQVRGINDQFDFLSNQLEVSTGDTQRVDNFREQFAQASLEGKRRILRQLEREAGQAGETRAARFSATEAEEDLFPRQEALRNREFKGKMKRKAAEMKLTQKIQNQVTPEEKLQADFEFQQEVVSSVNEDFNKTDKELLDLQSSLQDNLDTNPSVPAETLDLLNQSIELNNGQEFSINDRTVTIQNLVGLSRQFGGLKEAFRNIYADSPSQIPTEDTIEQLQTQVNRFIQEHNFTDADLDLMARISESKRNLVTLSTSAIDSGILAYKNALALGQATDPNPDISTFARITGVREKVLRRFGVQNFRERIRAIEKATDRIIREREGFPTEEELEAGEFFESTDDRPPVDATVTDTEFQESAALPEQETATGGESTAQMTPLREPEKVAESIESGRWDALVPDLPSDQLVALSEDFSAERIEGTPRSVVNALKDRNIWNSIKAGKVSTEAVGIRLGQSLDFNKEETQQVIDLLQEEIANELGITVEQVQRGTKEIREIERQREAQQRGTSRINTNQPDQVQEMVRGLIDQIREFAAPATPSEAQRAIESITRQQTPFNR